MSGWAQIPEASIESLREAARGLEEASPGIHWLEVVNFEDSRMDPERMARWLYGRTSHKPQENYLVKLATEYAQLLRCKTTEAKQCRHDLENLLEGVQCEQHEETREHGEGEA